MLAWVQLVGGLVVLTLGADLLVRGASTLAALLRVSPLVVSLTVVAYGTGTPELAVSSLASLAGEGDIALGNVVGSNIFNLLAVLGASACIGPLIVSRQILSLDLPVMIGASVLLYLFARDGGLSMLESVALLGCLAMYATVHLRQARRENRETAPPPGSDTSAEGRGRVRELAAPAGLILSGLAMLVVGSEWLVTGAVTVADRLGASRALIAVLIVAPGTGMPELATSIVASVRGERDIAIGNVVGSNTFNLLGVLGVSGLVSQTELTLAPSFVALDLPVMVLTAIACYPVFLNDLRLRRLEGAGLVAAYAVYVSYLVLQALDHPALSIWHLLILRGLLPLTGVLLVAATIRGLRRHVLRSPPRPR